MHLELPEDIAGEKVPEIPLVKPHPIHIPVADSAALDRAAELILKAERPLVMLVPRQAGLASRAPCPISCSAYGFRSSTHRWERAPSQAARASTWALPPSRNATCASSDRSCRSDRRDGHDAVEKPPYIMGPRGPTVLHVAYLPATVEEVYFRKLNSSAISVRALSC